MQQSCTSKTVAALSYKLLKYKSYQRKIFNIKRKSLPTVTYHLHISQFTPLCPVLACKDSPTFLSLNSIKKYKQSDLTNIASYLHQTSISNTKKQRTKISLSYRHLHKVDEDIITYFFPVSVHAVDRLDVTISPFFISLLLKLYI